MCLAQGPQHSDAGEVSSQALSHCAPLVVKVVLVEVKVVLVEVVVVMVGEVYMTIQTFSRFIES